MTKLTASETAKLAALQSFTRTGKLAKVNVPTKEEEIADDLNPNFMFSTTWTDLLSKIAKGEIDANFYARQELCNRGLDLNGNWIGFKAAKAEHKM